MIIGKENRKVWVEGLPGRKYLVLRWIDSSNGSQRQRSAKTTEWKVAEKLAAQLEAQLHEKRYEEPCRVSWDEFRESYETEYLPALAPRSRSAAASAFNHLERILRPRKLAGVTAWALSKFQAQLRAENRRETTIASHLRQIKAALNWGKRMGWLSVVPSIEMPKRAKGAKVMRGRPITEEELERMLAQLVAVVGEEAADAWKFFLRGLWWSGLRLGESLLVDWERHDRLWVDFSGEYPMLRIPAELEKGNTDRLLPLAPEFAKHLETVPKAARTGAVFKLPGLRIADAEMQQNWVGKIVSRIGKAAKIKVDTDPLTGEVKYASSHDLRRAFGERWASRVMPNVLQEMMRHEDIKTTLKFYVGRNAQRVATELWIAFESRQTAATNEAISVASLEHRLKSSD